VSVIVHWARTSPTVLGNLIAAAVMGTYLWRTHPELTTELNYALAGEE
jgi:hypothetical protein